MSILDDDVRHDMVEDNLSHASEDRNSFSTKVKPSKKSAQGGYLNEFVSKMRRRLAMGAKKYDDKSFLTDNLFTDIKEELLDFANYAYLLYERIRRLELGEKASDYLHFCRAVDITDEGEDQKALAYIFDRYRICYRMNGREHHFCQKGENENE